MPDLNLSIIIVNYNVKEFLEQALLSIQKALDGLSAEIFVVDNASQDGSVELIKERFHEVKLITNLHNYGFATANNQALREAKGKYIALINPDTLVQEDTFSKCIQFFEHHPETGVVGCKILNPDGSLQLACRRCYPTPWVAFTKIIGLSRLFPKSRLFGRYNLTFLDADLAHEVDAISGSFMMLRREVLQQVGYLDESFFMYGEDLDWCYRIKKSGWKIHYIPDTKIIHYKGESAKKSELDSLLMFYRAMLLFVKKHFRKKYFLLLEWLLILGIALRGGISFALNMFKNMTLPLIDLLFLNLSLVIAIAIRFGGLWPLRAYLVVDGIYSLVWLTSLYFFQLYDRRKFSVSQAVAATIVGLVINASLTYFIKTYAFSRIVVMTAGILNILFLSGWRLLVQWSRKAVRLPSLSKLGKAILKRRTLVVGPVQITNELIAKLRNIDSNYEVVGAINTNKPGAEGISYGKMENLKWMISHNKVQEVIFAAEGLTYEQIFDVIAQAQDWGVNFKLVPSNLEVIIGKASIDRIDNIPLVDIDYKLAYGSSRLLKRTTDILVSTVLIVVSFPFFVYWRYFKGARLQPLEIVGRGGRQLRIFNLSLRSGDKGWWTRIPLLWAVLKGDLSLVGSEIISGNEVPQRRINLKPGLTGMVQVNPESHSSPQDKERYELFYMKNYSPLLDAEIIFRSIFKL